MQWYKKLSINNAYGQLVLLIFFPISILALVSTLLVLKETSSSALNQQKNDVNAIFSRYIPQISTLIKNPDQAMVLQSTLQHMLEEAHLKRVALIDTNGNVKWAFGYAASGTWSYSKTNHVFGPVNTPFGNAYGQQIEITPTRNIWLVLGMDNQPLELAQYRSWLGLTITVLSTLLVLLLCLNIYAHQWIEPIYNLRIHLQKINKYNLTAPINIKSSGELQMLQKDLTQFMEKIYLEIKDLDEYAIQLESDFQRNLDALEMQNINFRKSRDDALRANAAKSHFLANISHELRTPLNSIDGFIALLMRNQKGNSEQKMFLNTIQRSSAHLLALINDILDFSKIEAGKLLLENAPFNLFTAVFDVLDMLSPLAYAKKLNLAVFIYEDVPFFVSGDELRFKQILTNLVSNAIKFTPDGDITVRVHLEEVLVHKQTIYVTIQDTGIGLTDQDAASLFESFGQADASVTRQYGGTGLGLSIVKQLTHLMEGDVGASSNQDLQSTRKAYSQLTKGATFWFKVNLGIEPDAMQRWPDLSNIRVLAFLEHAASLNVLRGYLARMNVVFEEASSIPDLFRRLTRYAKTSLKLPPTQDWVIVDATDDPNALIAEIRARYAGKVVFYGANAALSTLPIENIQHLYSPLNPIPLQKLLENKQENTNLYRLDSYHLHILIVDDHEPNLLVLDALLVDLGVRVTSASSGLEAIEIITHRFKEKLAPFNLILMDIQMPRLSGGETTQKIRDLEKTWQIANPVPIVALTAHALSDEREKLLANGLNDYATKPISEKQLLGYIQKWALPDLPIINIENPLFTQNQTVNTPSPTPIDELPLFDWQESLRLSSNKPLLAKELLQMLLHSFPNEQRTLSTDIQNNQYDQLAKNIHRLYGATKYTGAPKLRAATHQLNQLLIPARDKPHEIPENIELIKDITEQILTIMKNMQKVKLTSVADIFRNTSEHNTRRKPPAA